MSPGSELVMYHSDTSSGRLQTCWTGVSETMAWVCGPLPAPAAMILVWHLQTEHSTLSRAWLPRICNTRPFPSTSSNFDIFHLLINCLLQLLDLGVEFLHDSGCVSESVGLPDGWEGEGKRRFHTLMKVFIFSLNWCTSLILFWACYILLIGVLGRGLSVEASSPESSSKPTLKKPLWGFRQNHLIIFHSSCLSKGHCLWAACEILVIISSWGSWCLWSCDNCLGRGYSAQVPSPSDRTLDC